jgi:lipoyl(octanoyl) transferase
MNSTATATIVRRLGLVDYEPTWRKMQTFTDERTTDTADEIWILQHPPVFTLGMNGDRAHLLTPGDIPIIDIDRGGQVTYHGPGQLVVYPLLDLGRLSMGVRTLVTGLEQAVISTVAHWGLEAYPRKDAPGVYVDNRKLASLGLRIRRDCSYHGLALNVDMDLEPFHRINVCGYQGMEVTQLRELGVPDSIETIARRLESEIIASLGLAVATDS